LTIVFLFFQLLGNFYRFHYSLGNSENG